MNARLHAGAVRVVCARAGRRFRGIEAFSVLLLVGLASAGAIPEPRALRLPNPPPDGLPRGLVFDYNVTADERSHLSGQVYFIWGAQSAVQPPGVVPSHYLPYARDPDRTHTLAWYQANHPDWVMYQADRVTPAWGFTYSNGNCMPLDISNPEVRQYYYRSYVQPAVQAGFPVVAFDNAGITNWDHRCGHYSQGRWVQTFSGGRVDAAYAAAVIGWLEYLRDRLHATGVAIAANIKCYNEPLVAPDDLRREVEAVDVFCDEGGFTFHRESNLGRVLWEAKVAFLQRVLPGHAYLSVNSMAGSRPTRGVKGVAVAHDVQSKKIRTRLSDASPRQVDYAIASFLLARESGSMLALIGQEEHGTVPDRPELHVNLGRPLRRGKKLASGVWCREYEHGFAFVNPGSRSPVSVPMPAGRWETIRGEKVTGAFHLPANSGVVLIKREDARDSAAKD